MEGVTTLVGQGLYMATAAVVGLGLARVLRTDNTLGCLIAGVLAGMLLPVLDYDTGLRAENIHQLVFFVILPVLIFESAWQIEPSVLKRWLGPVLLFATVGVVICALLIALLTYYGINHPTGFPWMAALLTGAILSATDPVAVVAKMRQSDTNQDLLTLVEGESLFNDAAAIVFFSLVLGVASHTVMEGGASTGEPLQGAGTVATYFAVTLFGGIAVGLLCGLLTAIVALFLRSAGAALMTLVLAAFGSFYLAEHVVHVSGIISVMVCAIVARACLREQSETYLVHAEPTWEWLGMLFSALIFVIMGLTITFEMFTHQYLAMLVAIAAATGARALSVFMMAPMSRFVGPPIPKSWRLVLGWGGLRGVIAVALVLSLPVELPYWWTVQSMVFGVVLFSLLVQGTSSAWLIKKLDL
ncbi:monovalent cation:H+ antiporter, CPA1 family [Microbulbifer donghaiensis]|uniref:Monovalent cation:H+ antiporter, CPA1 family n=1 Tax=Microbulbifer donghaiensis TaxID=494016 RepID=A0A1M4X2M2_9GAMM|nr:sodium:proton antiporter [Microbulbifer donghaiensis]SHE87731.1 monovalent cation:H+ antiporter, CPA1 family [Microbulbifer donghaiensis]